MKKIILAMIIVIVVIMGGFFAYDKVFAPKTPLEIADPIAGWKTYTNAQYGFKLNYSEGYILSEKTETDLKFKYYPARLVGVTHKDSWADSNVYISADSDGLAVNQCLQGESGIKSINGADWHIIYEKAGDAAMGGERGITTDYKILHNGQCYGIMGIVHYRIVGYAGIINTGKSSATPEEIKAQEDSIKKQSQKIDQIISTFKFTK